MYSHQSLNIYIENKRRDMIEAANHYGMSSEITIKQSQELDELLNKFLGLAIENKEKEVEHHFSY
jgi:hypothetical protein